MKGGQFIREARRRAGITQAELARRVGTTQSAVARYEANEVSPRVETLFKVVRACGFDLDIRMTELDTEQHDWGLVQLALTMSPTNRARSNDNFVDFALKGRKGMREALAAKRGG